MLYRSPKNHVSLSPRVRHTRSKRSFPFHFTYRTRQPEISTSWSILAGKFPSPSLPKFDIITFHHELNLPVQRLSCPPPSSGGLWPRISDTQTFFRALSSQNLSWLEVQFQVGLGNRKKREDEAHHAEIDLTHGCAFLPIFPLKGYFQNL